MKNKFLGIASLFFLGMTADAQQIKFEEYDLPNGLHVILHQDNSAPVVTTSVMYHAGAKDEAAGRTGFAHFFEHLLFEGTKNIARGDWFKIVSSNGGTNNANTTGDRTYYYEVRIVDGSRENEASCYQSDRSRYTKRSGERGEKIANG